MRFRVTFSAFLWILLTSLGYADERTDVVVIGNNASSIAAGIQAARSGVKTIWINPESSIELNTADTTLTARAGIWPEFVKLIKGKSTLTSSQLVKGFTDTVKNLTVINNAVRKIERAGKGWEVKLSNGREIKCQVLVDGGKHMTLIEKAPEEIAQRLTTATVPANIYSSRLYRTAISSGSSLNELTPLASLVSKAENYIFAPSSPSAAGSMLVGQGAGATAAYCAYFKTTTRNLNIRMTQGELLRYSGMLLPTPDVHQSDAAFLPVQHVLATGILKLQNGAFNPQGTLTSEELRLPMKEFYSRSQLWFLNNKKDSLTVADAINLIMWTATRGEELRREIESGWQTSLKLPGSYDPKRAITRREFAVLVDRFLQPFSVKVDFNGNLLS